MKIRQTNFPKAGDDEKISLRNSNYPRFPLDFAIAMKDNTPKIWGAGGNIEGNRSFRLLRDHIENDNNSETILKKRGQVVISRTEINLQVVTKSLIYQMLVVLLHKLSG